MAKQDLETESQGNSADNGAAQEEPTLREMLESARDEVASRQEEEPIEPQQKTEIQLAESGTRGRDAHGRFSAKTSADSKEGQSTDKTPTIGSKEPTEVSAPQKNTDSQSTDTPATAAQSIEAAPQYWTPAGKAIWSQVPPAARAEIVRREQETHRRLTQHDEIRNVGNEFMRTANEFAPIIQARGSNPVALFREFMGILNTLQNSDPNQRAALFRDLATRNGADLRALIPAQSQGVAPSADAQSVQPNGNGAAEAVIHPAVSQMVREWRQFSQQQADYQRQQAESQRQREAEEEAKLTAEVQNFRSEPGHEHFDQVTDLMASIIRGNAAQTLEEAYALAVRAHPQTYASLQEAEKAKQQAEEAAKQAAAAEKARQKADTARRKSGSVRGGPGSTQVVTGSRGTVRDDLYAALEEARARA